jgi:[acyl-carrier-protein] S-malonyltransferase
VLALLFPGQGSQEVGMGRDVARASSAAREVFEIADSALGFSLSELCFEGSEEALLPTEIQQPAILTTSIALFRALKERLPTLRPGFVAGHSLGEYSAIVAAGALALEDAVRLVHARGRYMQEAVSQGRGAMAAVIGATAADVDRACAESAEETAAIVTAANYNSPQQTVIAGDAAAVELACSKVKQLGAKRTVPLKVSAPFHCSLMAPAADKLALELQGVRFSDASPPVVMNVEAEPNASALRIPELLRAQVTAPVRFTEMVARLSQLGVTRFLEVGPGRVLSGLVARIERRSQRASLGGWADIESACEFASQAGSGGEAVARGDE